MARYASIGAALLVTMVLTRVLDQDVFGAYRKVWLVYAIVGPAFVNTLANTLYYRGKAGEGNIAISVNLMLGAVYGLITGLIGLVFAGFWASALNIPEFTDAFRMFSPYMALAVFAGIAEPLFITLKRKKWLVGYSVGYNIIEFCLIVIPFAMGLPIAQILLIMAIGPAIRSLIVIGVALQGMQQWPGWSAVKAELPVSLKYGWGIFLLTAVSLATVYTDKWVVGVFFDSDSLYAIYEIGAKKIPFVVALTSAVSAALVAEYAGDLKTGSFSGIVSEARKASARLSYLVVPGLCMLFVYAEEVLFLLFGGYSESAPIFRVYLLTILTQLVFPQSILLGVGRSDVNARFGVAELVFNLIFSIALVMSLGLIGPAIATLLGHVLFTLLLFRYCRRKYGIKSRSLIPGKEIASLLWMLPVVIAIGAGLKYGIMLVWPGFAVTAAIVAILSLYGVKAMKAEAA